MPLLLSGRPHPPGLLVRYAVSLQLSSAVWHALSRPVLHCSSHLGDLQHQKECIAGRTTTPHRGARQQRRQQQRCRAAAEAPAASQEQDKEHEALPQTSLAPHKLPPALLAVDSIKYEVSMLQADSCT